jgi:hypothetical protein
LADVFELKVNALGHSNKLHILYSWSRFKADVLQFSRNVSLLSLLGLILRRDPLFSASIGTFRHGLQRGITKKVEERNYWRVSTPICNGFAVSIRMASFEDEILR